MGGAVELAVRAVVGAPDLVARLPQVVLPTRGLGLAGLLGVIPRPGQVPVQQPGQDPVRQDGRPRARTDQVLATARMVSCTHGAARRDLGLVDRRHRLRVPEQPAAARPMPALAPVMTTV